MKSIIALAIVTLLALSATPVLSQVQSIYVQTYATGVTNCTGPCNAVFLANLTVGTAATALSSPCQGGVGFPTGANAVIYADNAGATVSVKFYNDTNCTQANIQNTAPYATCIPYSLGGNVLQVELVKSAFASAPVCPAVVVSSTASSSSSGTSSSAGTSAGGTSSSHNDATPIAASNLATVVLFAITSLFLSRRF